MFSLKQTFNKLLSGRANEHEPDKALLVTAGIIVIFGLIMLSSASSAYAYAKYHDSYYFFKQQLFGLMLGLVAFWFFSRADYHIWKKYAFWFLIFSIILLLLVFIPGLSTHYGKARSWINIFGFSLQPSEFVKLSFLLYLSAWLESRKGRLKEVGEGAGPFLAVLGIIALLMLLQPDFGTLSIIVFTSLIIYFVGGGSKKHIFIIVLAAVLSLMVMIKFKPYQADRFKCFTDSNYSSQDVCYQVNQSLIAVGSGGFWGRGLGESRQKFMYIPEVSGDSIFAVIGEEIGFMFSAVLVFLFIFLFYRGQTIARNAPDDFGRILAIGIVSWITIQAVINIGGMINFMPMTGVPLPFVSYGGSALLAALSAMGILANISKQTRNRE
ncbi:putative lipid II flippase FtsW [Candidatus Falkowbacteria bacterium]|nr:putative lipid II flippase FtsW [Candidatus Falkowbacteria bacterium]